MYVRMQPSPAKSVGYILAGTFAAVLCLACAGGASLSRGFVTRSQGTAVGPRFSMAGARPSTRIKSEFGMGMRDESPLNPALIPADLPYNAKKEGFTTAIEHAIRNRDLAAVRKLEQARVEVIAKTENGGASKMLEQQRQAFALNRRKKLMDLSISRRQKEDALVEEMRRIGELSIDVRDQFGCTYDVYKVIDQMSDTFAKVLSEPTNTPRLITMKDDVDPMPWWDFPRWTINMRVAQMLREKMGLRKVVVLLEDPYTITTENYDGLVVGSLNQLSEQDLAGADLVVTFEPQADTLAGAERIIHASKVSNCDVLAIRGEWGFPSDFEAKKVRSLLKDVYGGGLTAISFVMPPVKLVPEVGGDPYPLPQWLVDAGYKATGNVAVTGNSGTGKSSLNNALRGLTPRDAEAAAVGVKETTLDPEGYEFSLAGPDMKLWDLPGAGTPRFPLQSYMRNMGIKYFDEVVIASASRFTETDLALMDELRQHGIPFIALRTKIDLELKNAAHDSGSSEAETLRKIREDIKMNSLLPDDRIYMVSVRKQDEYDFQRLREYIIRSLHRAKDVKLAKALHRKLEVQTIYNTVC